MIPPAHLEALAIILNRLDGQAVDWAVTGSLGMALQGMPVGVGDIDLQTSPPGAYAIQDRLSEFRDQPVRWVDSERMRSYLGRLVIHGVPVEIIGGIQKRLPDGSWETPVDIRQYRRWVTLGSLRAPVLALEYEYHAYRLMGRLEKADCIRQWLDDHPPIHAEGQ